MADPTCLALCAGVAGLERGIAAAAGGLRVLAYVERDPYAAATLLARMEDSSLDPAPIWCGDLAELDASPLAGLVDILCAGFPCQPFSVAGKRRGTADHRWIWPDIAGIIRDVGPGLVFLENVPGLVQHGMPDVLGTLADLGYDATWDLFRASDVGAPHKRERWFCLAHPGCRSNDQGQPQREPRSSDAASVGEASEDVGNAAGGRCDRDHGRDAHERRRQDDSGRRSRMADARVERLEGIVPPGAEARATVGGSGTELADAESGGLGKLRGTSRRAGLAQFPHPWPPRPDELDRWAGIDAETQPAVRRVADELPARVDRLRCLGNSVVPAQAELAFRTLYRRMLT